MKNLMALFLLLGMITLHAQRHTGFEKVFILPDAKSQQKISVSLNPDWFKAVTDTSFASDDGVKVIVLGTGMADPGFAKALDLVKKGKALPGDSRKWKQVDDKEILKATELYDKDGLPIAAINYAIYVKDGRVIAIMVFMEEHRLGEWENYLDFIATTVKLQ